MSKFKVGDRVKVIGDFIHRSGQEAVVEAVISDTSEVLLQFEGDDDSLYYYEQELELIKMQEKKTKTVKKYAVMEDYLRGVRRYYSEDEVLSKNEAAISVNAGISYHIVPTLFVEEEVPVKTETRYTFICVSGCGGYYPSNRKYKDLSSAKASTANEAIQQIDSSAEEFEIE